MNFIIGIILNVLQLKHSVIISSFPFFPLAHPRPSVSTLPHALLYCQFYKLFLSIIFTILVMCMCKYINSTC